jgi:hypothetical protein
MVGLPLDWANAALLCLRSVVSVCWCLGCDFGKKRWISDDKTYHPDQPLDRLPILVAVVRERDLVVFIVLLAEVQLHAGALEDTLGFAGGVVD